MSIEKIKPGDYVWSENPETNEKALKKVNKIFVREKDSIVRLSINGEIIETTNEHPFYVEGKGFIGAGKLTYGDEVRLQSGDTAAVDDIDIGQLDEPIKVYNFEVEDFHTYYVSEQEVLVHNTCIKNSTTGSFKGTLGKANNTLALPAPQQLNPWKEGSDIISLELQEDLYVNMAMAKGQTMPGKWATLDNIPNVDYVRNSLAVTPEFKADISHVQTFKIPKGSRIQIGTVGPQNYDGVHYPGGGTQIHIVSIPNNKRLLPVGNARKLY